MAHATILVVDLTSLTQELIGKFMSRSDIAIAIDDSSHTVQSPEQIHRRRATGGQIIAKRFGSLHRLFDRSTTLDQRSHPRDDRIGRCDANGRCSTDPQRYDRLVGLLDALDRNHPERLR